MWFYVQNNERRGPVDEAAAAALIQSGIIMRPTLVWKEGMPNWVAAEQTELYEHLRVTPPAVQPPARPAPGNSMAATYTPASLYKLWLWFAGCWASACRC